MKRRTDMAKVGQLVLTWLEEVGIDPDEYAQPPTDKWDYWRLTIAVVKGEDAKEAFDRLWGAQEEIPF